ncbi:uncharacterized protein V1516DRAFT_113576 [Lipomyces oligophaga]|uniref:uncharacterized protein n=1 Tax=Lipomyces oligophaga TaxID=45792 RepID=UPI0034CEEFDB
MEYTFTIETNEDNLKRKNKQKREPIKRPRPSTICKSCAQRRIKCDRQKPACGTCREKEYECVYGSPSAEAEIEKSKEKLETAEAYHHAPDRERATNIGVLAADRRTGSFRYANASYWPLLFEEDMNVDSIVHVVGDEFDRGDCSETRLRFTQLFITSLPTRQESDELVAEYLRSVYPFCVLITRREFIDMYDKFWQDTSDQSNYLFICVLFAVFYGASVARHWRLKFPNAHLEDRSNGFTSVGRGNASCETQMRMYLEVTEMFLRLCQFESKPCMMSLISATILQTSRQPSDSFAHASGVVTHLVRLAQTMGLHRDPKLFSAASRFKTTFTPEEAELRRRVWWHLIGLDAIVSIGNGLPLSVNSSSFDVDQPSLEVLEKPEQLLVAYATCLSHAVRLIAENCASMTSAEYDLTTHDREQEGDKTAGTGSEAGAHEDGRRCVIEHVTAKVKAQFSKTVKIINGLELTTDSSSMELPFDLETVRRNTTLMLALVCDRSFLMMYHLLYEHDRVSADRNSQLQRQGARWTVGDDEGKVGEEAREQGKTRALLAQVGRRLIAEAAMRSLRVYEQLMELPGNAAYRWYHVGWPQFHAMVVLLRDVCIEPGRALFVDDSTLLTDVARDFVCRVGENGHDGVRERADDRLARVERAMEISEYYGQNRELCAGRQWSRMKQLKEAAVRAVGAHENANVQHETQSCTRDSDIMIIDSDEQTREAGIAKGELSDDELWFKQLLDQDVEAAVAGWWMDESWYEGLV